MSDAVTGTEILKKAAELFVLRVLRQITVGEAIRLAAANLGGCCKDGEAELLKRIPAAWIPNPKRPGKRIHPIDAWDNTETDERKLAVLRGEP